MPRQLRNTTRTNTSYSKLHNAISNCKPVKITYHKKTRVVYPLKMGNKTTKKRVSHKNVLCLEKIEPENFWQVIIRFFKPYYKWRGFTLDKIEDIEVLNTEFISNYEIPYTTGKNSTLIDKIEVEVNIPDDDDDDVLHI